MSFLTDLNTALADLSRSAGTSSLKIGLVLGLFLLSFVGGGWLVYNWAVKPTEIVRSEDSKVLLEKIQKVCKLVTVEGSFSDIYSYEDHYYYDISLFTKKALLKVNAKVLVGVDLTKAKFATNTARKELTISNIPQPEILSIDPDVQYYDVTEGTFNNFTAAELTQLNVKAKAQIKEKAQNSELMHIAEKQGNAIFDLMEYICTDAGWRVVYNPPRKTEAEKGKIFIDTLKQ